MNWIKLLDIIEEEVGHDAMLRIEQRARMELGGERLTISAKRKVRAKDLDRVAPGQPKRAAKILGIHPSTAYRRLAKPRVIR